MDPRATQIAEAQARRIARGLKPQKRVRLARPPNSRAEARRYGAALRARLAAVEPALEAILSRYPALVRQRDPSLVVDAAPLWADEVETLISETRRAYYQRRTVESLRAEARARHEQVSEENAVYLQGTYQRVLGVSLFADESWLLPELEAAVEGNVSLIVSLERELFGKVQAQVTQAIRNGIRVEELRSQLLRTYDITRGRADLIARDQLASWSGQINQTRQERVGIKEYVWRTSRDERVVGNPDGRYPEGSRGHQDHFHREGKVFTWADPPADGHPGAAFQCRCTPEPVIPEIADIKAEARAAELPVSQTAAFDPLAFARPSLQNAGPTPNPPAGLRRSSGRRRG